MSEAPTDDAPTVAVPTGALDDHPTRATATSARVDATTGDRAALLEAGATLGRYVVLAPVGSGGLGDVYAAYDPQLDRRVAIKLLRPAVEHDERIGSASDRMLREGQAMAKLRHPNVVGVHDVGRDRGRVFIAMEFVDGRTLRRWLAEEPRSWQTVRDAFLDAGAGLAAAHAAGLVHRDFKPANVLVARDGHIAVLDFGLARQIDELAPALDATPESLGRVSSGRSLLASEVTERGTVMGSPPYMAPELFVGEAASPRSDQFAFCVSLFEALYRRRPFEGATFDDHLAAVRAGIASADRPDRRVPPWLHRAVLRGLEARAERRFESMQELLAAMVVDRARRRRMWLSLAIAAPLLSVSVAGVAIALRPEATATEREAIELLANEARAAAAQGYYVYPPSDDPQGPTAYAKVLALESLGGAAAEPGAAMATALRGEMAQTLERLGDEYAARPGGAPFAADFWAAALVFDPSRDDIRARVALTPGELASLRERAGAQSFSENELIAAEALSALAAPDAATREARVAAVLEREGSPITTAARLEAVARPARIRTPGPASPVVDAPVGPAAAPAPVVATDARDAPAQPTAAPARDTPPAPPAPSASVPASKTGRAAIDEGNAALRRGELAGAEAAFGRALRLDPANTSAMLGLGRVHFHRRDYKEMAAIARRVTELQPRSAAAFSMLGDAYYKMYRYDDALSAYERAAELGSSDAEQGLARVRKAIGER